MVKRNTKYVWVSGVFRLHLQILDNSPSVRDTTACMHIQISYQGFWPQLLTARRFILLFLFLRYSKCQGDPIKECI